MRARPRANAAATTRSRIGGVGVLFTCCELAVDTLFTRNEVAVDAISRAASCPSTRFSPDVLEARCAEIRRSRRSQTVLVCAAMIRRALLASFIAAVISSGCVVETNEGCAAGTVVLCAYAGPANMEGIGACRAGTKTCAADGSGFGDCSGEVVPVAETCATPFDDDCDGEVNESGAGCTCTPGQLADCYTGSMATRDVGACRGGLQVCNPSGTGYGECQGEVLPLAAENCATVIDDDCDGETSECLCAPGAQSPCYSGPPDTNGVGACTTGVAICEPDGMSFGACAGEVLPSIELCPTIADESCDGDVSCHGLFVGLETLSGDGNEFAEVVVDARGDLAIAASFTNGINLAGRMYGGAGNQDIFVAKLDRTRSPRWANWYGDAPADQSSSGVALDGDGNVLVTGSFEGTLEFGCGMFTSAGSRDVFVAKLSATDGACLWSKRYGDGDDQAAQDIAIGADGGVLIVGRFNGSLNFEDQAQTSAGNFDLFVAKLDPTDGHAIWSRRYGDGSDQSTISVAVDSMNNVLLTGAFAGGIDFEGRSFATDGPADFNIFISKLDSNGAVVWANEFGDPAQQQSANDVAIDLEDNIWVVGHYQAEVNFGGATHVARGGVDAFVAKLRPDGGYLFSRSYGESGFTFAYHVNVDAAGNGIVGGYWLGNADLGLGARTSDSRDGFVLKLDSWGAPIWTQLFGAEGVQQVRSVAAGPNGDVFTTLDFNGVLIAGGQDFSPRGGTDVVLLQFSP